MSLSDKLSPEDRKAYAEAYEPLAKLRDAYVAAGDQQSARRIRRQISALSAYYQKRAKPFTMNISGVWFDEASKFPPEAWNKIAAMDFGDAESRIMAHMYEPKFGAGGFVSGIKEVSRGHGGSWAKHQIAMYREVFKNFFTPPTKEQTMIEVFNSSDDPSYHTDNRAGVSLTHLLTKDQMFEIAKMAFKEHNSELLDFIGLKGAPYDGRRAQVHIKRALDVYPLEANQAIEQRGYRKIQPYTLEVALRQVAEAERVYPHAFKNRGGEPAFCNQVDQGGIANVYHNDKDKALEEAERLATRTGADVRTYQLVATTKIEEVPVMTKRVVRRP